MDLAALIAPRHHQGQEVLSPADGPGRGLRDPNRLLVDARAWPLFLPPVFLLVSYVLLRLAAPASRSVAVASPVVKRVLLVGELFGKVTGVVPQREVGASRLGGPPVARLRVGVVVVEQAGGVFVVSAGGGCEGAERDGNVCGGRGTEGEASVLCSGRDTWFVALEWRWGRDQGPLPCARVSVMWNRSHMEKRMMNDRWHSEASSGDEGWMYAASSGHVRPIFQRRYLVIIGRACPLRFCVFCRRGSFLVPTGPGILRYTENGKTRASGPPGLTGSLSWRGCGDRCSSGWYRHSHLVKRCIYTQIHGEPIEICLVRQVMSTAGTPDLVRHPFRRLSCGVRCTLCAEASWIIDPADPAQTGSGSIHPPRPSKRKPWAGTGPLHPMPECPICTTRDYPSDQTYMNDDRDPDHMTGAAAAQRISSDVHLLRSVCSSSNYDERISAPKHRGGTGTKGQVPKRHPIQCWLIGHWIVDDSEYMENMEKSKENGSTVKLDRNDERQHVPKSGYCGSAATMRLLLQSICSTSTGKERNQSARGGRMIPGAICSLLRILEEEAMTWDVW